MADKRFSDLTVATSITDTDLLAISQSGVSKQALGSVLKAFITGGSVTLGGVSTDTVTFNASTVTLNNSTTISAASTKTLTLNGGGLTNGLVLNASNNVGIGTSSPTAKLEVLGTLSACRSTGTTSSASIAAQVNDYWTTPSYRGTYLTQFDSAATGTICGLASANLGGLVFQNTSTVGAVIYTNGGTPLVFGTLSVERARIDTSGNFLIGQTSATGKLAVTQATAGATACSLTGVASLFNFDYLGSGSSYFDGTNIVFRTYAGVTCGSINNGTNASWRIASSTGYAVMSVNSATGNLAYYDFLVNSAAVARLSSDASGLYFATGSGNTTRMTLDASGNLGIGITTPGCKVDAAGTIRATAQTAPSSGSGAELLFVGGSSYLLSYDRTTPAFLPFIFQASTYRWDVGATASALALNSSGLSVGNGAVGAPSSVYINGGNTGANGPVIFGQAASSNEWFISSLRGVAGAGAGVGGMVDYVYGAYPRVFYTNAAERLRIDGSGNLGQGNVPSAWAAGYKAFDQGTLGALASSVGAAVLSYNLYSNGTNWLYKTSAAASMYQAQAGIHQWTYAASGAASSTTVTSGISYTITTAGGTNYTTFGAAANTVGTVFTATSSGVGNGGAVTQNATLNVGMSLNASGYLGIGTASPACPLDTNGMIRAISKAGAYPASGKGLEIYYEATSDQGILLSYDRGATAYKPLSYSASTHTFDISGTARMTLDASGNLTFTAATQTYTNSVTISAASTKTLTLNGGAGTNGLVLDASNNVGIGTATPSTDSLTVYKSAGPSARIQDTSGVIRFATSGGVNYIQSGIAGTSGSSAPLVFSNIYAANTWMTLDASGNLGIGAGSPSSKLYIASGTNNGLALYDGTVTTILYNTNSTNGSVGTASNHPFAFYTNSAERARVTSAGALCINNTSNISGNANTFLAVKSYGATSTTRTANQNVVIASNANGADCCLQFTDAVAHNYYFGGYNGTAYVTTDNSGGVKLAAAATAWAADSDERLKTDLKPIENATQKVATLRSVTGRYKTDEEGFSRAFLIAQDVQEVLPEAIDATDPESLGVRYTETIPLLVAAIKELSAQNNALEARLAQLEAK